MKKIIFFLFALPFAITSCGDDDNDNQTLKEYEKLIVGIFEPTDMMWSVKGERIYVFNENKTGKVYVLESFDQNTRKYTTSSVLNISNYFIDKNSNNNDYNIIIAIDAEWETERFVIKELNKSGLKGESRNYSRVSKINVDGVN